MIDSHIHLTNAAFNDKFPFIQLENGALCCAYGNRSCLIETILNSGIIACIEPAIELESNQKLLSLAKSYPEVIFPAVGIHPTRTYKYRTIDSSGNKEEKTLKWSQRRIIGELALNPAVIAIGETGLDFHYNRKEQYRIRQYMWFVWQLLLADRLNLPVILHIREADRQALRILKLFRKRIHGGVCHCFSGDYELAMEYINLGLSIGIGGMLISNNEKVRQLEDAVARIPLEWIVLETDGPYVKPEWPEITKKKLRKIRNTSLILPLIARRVAKLKGMEQEEVCKITSENVRRVFGLSN